MQMKMLYVCYDTSGRSPHMLSSLSNNILASKNLCWQASKDGLQSIPVDGQEHQQEVFCWIGTCTPFKQAYVSISNDGHASPTDSKPTSTWSWLVITTLFKKKSRARVILSTISSKHAHPCHTRGPWVCACGTVQYNRYTLPHAHTKSTHQSDSVSTEGFHLRICVCRRATLCLHNS